MSPIDPLLPINQPVNQPSTDDPKPKAEPAMGDKRRFEQALQKSNEERDARARDRGKAADRRTLESAESLFRLRSAQHRQAAMAEEATEEAAEEARQAGSDRPVDSKDGQPQEAQHDAVNPELSKASQTPPPADSDGNDARETSVDTGRSSEPAPQGDPVARRSGDDRSGSQDEAGADDSSEKDRLKGLDDGAASSKNAQPGEPSAVAGDRILQNLSGSRPDEASSAPPARHAATLNELVREIADRIQIGDSGPAGQQEVRITLRNEVLGGTEIRLSEHEGALNLVFVAGSTEAESFLQAQREEISTALGERLKREIRVEVTDRDRQRAEAHADGPRRDETPHSNQPRNAPRR